LGASVESQRADYSAGSVLAEAEARFAPDCASEGCFELASNGRARRRLAKTASISRISWRMRTTNGGPASGNQLATSAMLCFRVSVFSWSKNPTVDMSLPLEKPSPEPSPVYTGQISIVSKSLSNEAPGFF